MMNYGISNSTVPVNLTSMLLMNINNTFKEQNGIANEFNVNIFLLLFTSFETFAQFSFTVL